MRAYKRTVLIWNCIMILFMLCRIMPTYAADSEIPFTAEEWNYIASTSTLRVGYESTGSPMEYYDPKTQTAQGITIDLLRRISAQSGLKFEFVKTDSLDQALEMIKAGELDLLSGLVRIDHFAEIYHLSPTVPIAKNTLVFITMQGNHFEDPEILLAIPEKWIGLQRLMQENYPELKQIPYKTSADCLAAVKDNRAKLTIMTTLAAETALKAYQYRGMIVSPMMRSQLPICLGISFDQDPLLLSVLNKSISAIDVTTRKQIVYMHTISQPYQLSPRDLFHYNIPMFCVAAVILLFLLYVMAKHAQKKLNYLAYMDELTGEMNLNRFKLETQKLINCPDRVNAIMVIDIDKFKSINDLYGYDFGDRLLILVARTLHETLLTKSLLCHGNADKFYCFFEYVDQDWMEKRFHIIFKAVEEAVECNMPGTNIVLSCGVCLIRPEDKNIISIIDRANVAVKQVKSYHESSFAFYDQSMYDHINQIRTLESGMASSLRNEEFVVYLQPKVELTSKRIAGAEALVRWQHPERGLIPPDQFIPLFENNGFVVNLDFYVLEKVCQLLKRWKQEDRKLFTISVNLSRRHLFHSDTVKNLLNIVEKYDVDPQLIEVELTESAFDNCDIQAITTLFDELHSHGFTVSVDDFGAGYSSLSLLKDLPIDVLKIDKSLFDCNQSCKTEKIEILLESIISLSRSLHIRTVSEGVETEEQVNLLIRLGCDLVQGYYFSKPMPMDLLEKQLEAGDLFCGQRQEPYANPSCYDII
ncbi:MAG: EAL domain-containing protein [Hungatella sp.]